MDRMFALYGTMMHATLEKYANPDEGDLVERRLGFRVGNTWVHGQADLYEPASKTISDYKITSVESALYSDHYEHICQLNVLRYIFRLHGYKVEKTRNIYIYRNWARRDVNREGYPQEIIQEIEVPVWSDEEVMAYIKGRVETHDAASQLPDDDLPHCTPKERWERPTHWRVFKLDPKTGERQSRAKLRTENQSEVETFIDKTLDLEYEAAVEKNSALKTERAKKTPEQMLAGLSKYETVKYPGRAVKCAFCDSANFCSQRLAELEIISNQTEEDEE